MDFVSSILNATFHLGTKYKNLKLQGQVTWITCEFGLTYTSETA